MAVLRKRDLVQRYNDAQSYLIHEEGEKNFASKKLLEDAQAFDFEGSYDIFPSHSYQDARVVKQIRDELVENGFSVYVDWLEDNQLDRGKVTKQSATVLRNRMNACSSLIYLTSVSAEKSVWMPWELGYMDSRTGRVAVAPIVEDSDDEFVGREYLGLYPYLDLTSAAFYVHDDTNSWVRLPKWLEGVNPALYESGI